MNTYIGSTKLKGLYKGTEKIKNIYKGSSKIWSGGSLVTYNIDTNLVYTEEIDEGDSCLSPSSFTPTKTGWTFLGWREDSTANSSVLQTKISDGNPITLYAVFKQNITVTYYNYSNTASTSVKDRLYNNDNILNPIFNLTVKSISQYTIRGWSTSSEGNGEIIYNSGVNFTRDSDITLYASWTAVVTVYYNGNGATSGSVSPSTGTSYVSYNGNKSKANIVLRENAFVYPGCTFSHWFHSGDMGYPGETIQVANDTVYYAFWL